MTGETDLCTLRSSLAPRMLPDEYVYCTLPGGRYADHTALSPLASFAEEEGLSLVLPRPVADAEGLNYESVFRCITLSVHSSLDAVGLTAAVATQLADLGISANMMAAYHHDHILVPVSRAAEALAALTAGGEE